MTISILFPVLLLVLVFLAGLALIIIRTSNKCQRDKEREKYIRSINNIDKMMNNEPHTTNETELVNELSKYNIVYRPFQKK